MKISKRDALMWYSFFAQLPEDEPLMPRQQELALAVLSQIELAQERRIADLRAQTCSRLIIGSRIFLYIDRIFLTHFLLPPQFLIFSRPHAPWRCENDDSLPAPRLWAGWVFW